MLLTRWNHRTFKLRSRAQNEISLLAPHRHQRGCAASYQMWPHNAHLLTQRTTHQHAGGRCGAWQQHVWLVLQHPRLFTQKSMH